jgi:hypothetical protein
MGIEDRERREQDEHDRIEDLELDDESAAGVVGRAATDPPPAKLFSQVEAGNIMSKSKSEF